MVPMTSVLRLVIQEALGADSLGYGLVEPPAVPGPRVDVVAANGRATVDHLGSLGGSIRSTVVTRSIALPNEATLPTPVLSAQATRYASAMSSRSIS